MQVCNGFFWSEVGFNSSGKEKAKDPSKVRYVDRGREEHQGGETKLGSPGVVTDVSGAPTLGHAWLLTPFTLTPLSNFSHLSLSFTVK